MKTQKKILVDTFYLNTALTGIKTYMLEFSEAAKQFPQEDIRWIFTHHPLRQSQKTFFRGNVPKWRTLWYHLYYFIYKQLLLPVKVWIEKPDALICFDFVAPALTKSCHKITVVHDAFFWQMPQNYQSLWREYFIQMIHSGINGNTTVVTTSQYSKRALEKHAGITAPIEVIYQCPKLLPDNPEPGIMEKWHLRPRKFLLHVGSFDRRKNLPVLVEAFHSFLENSGSDLELVLVGEKGLSKTVDDHDKVIDLIQKKKLGQRVKVTGFLTDQDVKCLYDHAFAYVFPSSNEGFGIPVIEAMRSGVPVIISDQEALVEIAGEAALVHEMGNAESLSEKLSLLEKNPALQYELVQKGLLRWKQFGREEFLLSFKKLIH
ncbi:glycosyltransferase family 4 protein [Arthrospiribacter ruber]|uniref:Glycosyltransferase family 1 protein n=1 Tax=Arthrospiribacter ruber TaxID=2487934 RepID=A0A951MBW0_9BACT|nr:glycosyltransferase family 1 protein [Arthrospiribacter ruber]MBW3467529.1 glycosyltransferase family 1 protein [Arthrospiribacter ruber]